AAEAFRGEMEALIELEVGAEALERQKMRVDAAAADDVAARRRQLDLAAAREERRGQKNRRANLSAQLGVEARRLYGFRMNLKRVALRPRDVDAQGGDELDQRLDVANARHVLERHRVFGEQGRAHDGQRGVLVAGRANRSGQALSTLDDELQSAHVRG